MNKVKITINKTLFHFHFGLGFFAELKENQGIGMEGIQKGLEENSFKLMPKLMLEAGKYSAMRRNTDFKYTEFDIIDAIDNDGGISSPAYLKFLDAFTNSMTRGVPKEKGGSKKKTTAAAK